ncbi:hypothetical protein [Paludisphaera soli]|uniref:hypothetical protein n=1 Tax=Paludisphaera soli TaxID=2712865 RepID=UPI0013EA1D24|nr:hypothetical protein [Paludisphaera soli]
MRAFIKVAAIMTLAAPTPASAGDREIVGPPPGARIVLEPGSLRVVLPESRIRRGLGPADDDFRTAIRPAADARGEALRFQEGFAAAFAEADSRPPERAAHFNWLPHYDDHTVRHAGWRGEIRRAERQGDGSWRVEVRMTPLLRSTTLKTLILDYVEETYRVRGDAIEQVGSDAATPRPQLQAFPVHF